MGENTFVPFAANDIVEAKAALVGEVMRSRWITTSPRVKEIEGAFRHCLVETAAVTYPHARCGTRSGDSAQMARVIIPVHFGGLASNMPELTALAAEHDPYIVEDAAQRNWPADGAL